jgi:cupin fold WbuC family metalloprotein
MSGIKAIGSELFDVLSDAARQAPRLRKNYNLHPEDKSACHRLFNAIEPESYIRPHRHLHPEKDETLLVVRGRLGVVSFDEAGSVTSSAELAACSGAVAVDIAHGVYHSAVSLESGTIFFEAKAGPYQPLSDQEKAPFAPEEGTPEGVAFLKKLRELFQ